ncbi:MAG: hypothetical protein AAF434_17235 [Pseudomonadota bacterium]
MTDEEKVQYGHESKRAMEILQGAFDALDKGLIEQIKNTSFENALLREKLNLMLIVSSGVHRQIEHFMEEGRIAANELEQKSIFNRNGL